MKEYKFSPRLLTTLYKGWKAISNNAYENRVEQEIAFFDNLTYYGFRAQEHKFKPAETIKEFESHCKKSNIKLVRITQEEVDENIQRYKNDIKRAEDAIVELQYIKTILKD